MKKEINFRLGKGRATELKKAFSAKGLLAAFKFVGMSDEQIKTSLEKMRNKP